LQISFYTKLSTKQLCFILFTHEQIRPPFFGLSLDFPVGFRKCGL